ncbi:MAG TPA: ABC transporter ATP-binding protein [Cellvibrionaceae bacterium]|nr:ABC transporter ATP-binding protein [Cellvibrionaceae bacterium]HNG59360.1 ABC transporter ATP-binding protein [Cellvibrionaceae bacterium]
MKSLMAMLNLQTNVQVISFVAVVSLALLVVSNAVSVAAQWLLLTFSMEIGGSVQGRLFASLISRDYLFHKTNDYSASIPKISQDTLRFLYMVLQPILQLFSNGFVVVIILGGIVALNPTVAFVAGSVLSFAYAGTYYYLKKRTARAGDLLTQKTAATHKVLNEAFVGVKEIKLVGIERQFVDKFNQVNHQGMQAATFLSLAVDIPRYVIETIALSAIFISAIFALMAGIEPSSILPILSLYAVAGYKLLPTMQQVYKAVSSISAHGSVALDIEREIAQCSPEPIATELKTSKNRSIGLAVEVKSVSYQYPNTDQYALQGVSVQFCFGKINTIAGHSGSGKSTLLDIALGLLTPTSGQLLVGGEPISNQTARAYQQRIGFVPQHVFILNDSVARNVAFGEAIEHFDAERLTNSLKLAGAMEFVSRLPEGVNTVLGQDGKLLSGGQRQKIAIARCLYRNSDILFLDEPTSALDIDAEFEFMQVLEALKARYLIIIISHRPSAIRYSDFICLMKDGVIEAAGSFDELKQCSDSFRNLIEKSSME